ncbi:MAG: amidophosphoribosyltransferase [Endomicrobia bacterium]|nr:amidophosphoribosyltransferase [Endomicrobiia bacterium]
MCGIFAIHNHRDASELTYLGLYALQHRGQESAGIVSSDGQRFLSKIGQGEVQEVFSKEDLLRLNGKIAVGHTRYSTFGGSYVKNAQPIVVKCSKGLLALVHNGNLVNAKYLRKKLEQHGAIFQTTTDSEVILHLISHSKEKNMVDVLKKILPQLKGAYSLILMTPQVLYGIRDPYGFRPLVIGRLKNSFVLASETCALDIISAKFIREVEPGEIVEIKNNGIKSYKFAQQNKQSFCIFEYIYFSRPDSIIDGQAVHSVRERLGRNLYKELPTEADVVISVPDSANSAGLGYSKESGIPFEFGFIRNHYIGRTFIQPRQKIRDFSAKIKYNTVKEVLCGKQVVVVDDSIVRGTTSKKLISMLKLSGAKKIHLRITCPPIISPCLYGIDTPTKKELIAANHTVEEIRKFLGVDTLYYISLEGMISATGVDGKKFCLACFTGNYPVR